MHTLHVLSAKNSVFDILKCHIFDCGTHRRVTILFCNLTFIRYLVDAIQMIMNLLAWPSHQRNKIVILDHTFMFDYDEDYGEENIEQLKEFFRLAKLVGFQFRRLDTYLSD